MPAFLRKRKPDMNRTFHINGRDHTLTIDPRETLLEVLRDQLALTGTKRGCDHGQCGACTVLSDGKRILSCLQLAATQRGAVTTIEGLTDPDGLPHPMQAAFVRHDALQCGYCTPGQILSAVACIAEGHTLSADDVRAWMSGNLCRCAAYPNIVAAVMDVAGKTEVAR
jgi:xanthine dehydrogenase YagT iron-sulfur-binding subunit